MTTNIVIALVCVIAIVGAVNLILHFVVNRGGQVLMDKVKKEEATREEITKEIAVKESDANSTTAITDVLNKL